MKIRTDFQSNYKAFWFDSGKTFRLKIDNDKDTSELEYPEFYDIKIIDACDGGCVWCYQNSVPIGDVYEKSYSNLHKFLSSIPKDQLPFQIALGGGEPTQHKDFHDILQLIVNFNIVPNFTTNGMWVKRWTKEFGEHFLKYHTDKVKELCGGVAVSTHPQLEVHWRKAVEIYLEAGIRVNLHHIISSKQSIDRMLKILDEYKDSIDYMVLLPWIAQGRAREVDIDFDHLTEHFPWDMKKKIAWGAHFYDYLQTAPPGEYVSLYPPEMFSKYVDLGGTGTLYNSSFSSVALNKDLFK